MSKLSMDATKISRREYLMLIKRALAVNGVLEYIRAYREIAEPEGATADVLDNIELILEGSEIEL